MPKIPVKGSDAQGQCLSKGEYVVMVNEARYVEPKPRRGGEGGETQPRVDVDLVVADGEFANEVTTEMFFPWHESEFLRRRFASFTNAIGLTSEKDETEVEVDTDEMTGKFLVIEGSPEVRNGRKQFRTAEFRMHDSTAQAVEDSVNTTEQPKEQPKEEKQEAKPATPAKPAAPSRPKPPARAAGRRI